MVFTMKGGEIEQQGYPATTVFHWNMGVDFGGSSVKFYLFNSCWKKNSSGLY